MNRVSASLGMLVSRSVSSVRRLAAISLMAEFLAPLIGISPCSRAPPGDGDAVQPHSFETTAPSGESSGRRERRYLACGAGLRKGPQGLSPLFGDGEGRSPAFRRLRFARNAWASFCSRSVGWGFGS